MNEQPSHFPSLTCEKASQISSRRRTRSALQRINIMYEVSLGIHTNTWNALRYIIFTLVVVPSAELLWALFHSRRNGSRLSKGRTLRLRKSKLGYWGLHQEVDEKSWTSRLHVVLLCFLHLLGTLLLEYGSESRHGKTYQWKVLSPALSEGAALREDSIAFVDVGEILRCRSSRECCTDGRPRKAADFGLRYGKVGKLQITNKTAVWLRELSQPKFAFAFIRINNNGNLIHAFDNGKYRLYLIRGPFDRRTVFAAYVRNELLCLQVSNYSAVCDERKTKLNQENALSHVLALAGLRRSPRYMAPRYWRRGVNLKLSLENLRAYHFNETFSPVITDWVKSGMLLENIPPFNSPDRRKMIFLLLDFNSKRLLKEGCKHRDAVAVAGLQGLTASSPRLQSKRAFKALQGNELVMVLGKRLAIGLLTQTERECCVAWYGSYMCVSRNNATWHTAAKYLIMANETSVSLQRIWTFSIHGNLKRKHTPDLVVQALVRSLFKNVEDSLSLAPTELETANRAAEIVKNGGVFHGHVRLFGKGLRRKAPRYLTDMATINVFGLAGVGILIMLIPIPCLSLLLFRQDFYMDIESSYRRSVMARHGIQCCTLAPSQPPDIVAAEIFRGRL